MGPLVLDASVIAALYIEEPGTAAAREVLIRADEAEVELHAPDLLLVETANVLWKRVLREEFSPEDAMRAIDDLSKLAHLTLHPMEGRMVRQALLIALAHELTAYDAAYVAVAQSLSAGVLISSDRRLVERSRDAGFSVVETSDFASRD